MKRTAAVALSLTLLTACGATTSSSTDKLNVVTTTEILADLAQQVGGDRVEASSLVPPGGDPHSYEPTPKDAKRVAKADVTFTNHLLLEPQSLIKTIDANAAKDAPNVSLAEAAESYGANVIPLVENIGLDVLWLGLRVRGAGKQRGATRTSSVQLAATKLDGPGQLVAYLTESLGQPDKYFDSTDGLDKSDSTTLPPAAHTHLNWAFTKPGVYRLTLTGALDNNDGKLQPLGQGTFTFAVGVEPHTVKPASSGPATVLDDGHTDLTVDLDSGQVYAYSDARKVGAPQTQVPAGNVVIDVPNKALVPIPDDQRFSFLGKPGTQIHQLPQAVLGKHVHGEIDPHLWEDVANAKAYAQLMRDTLSTADPDGKQTYEANTKAYLAKLDDLDNYVRTTLATIPPARRQLVTTHDAFGYLASAYEMTVAGFVVPNPAQEPSVEQVRKLSDTIRNLRVPAVFTEPNLAQRASVLIQVARDQGVQVCSLYGDSFDDHARTYVDMMRHNADELKRCLGDHR
ncbi:anchored repeat ABC transporter, substrate-binding protein [Kribbella sandramycini]|uniref:Anchored repeat ABC transporter substrate-binding protein n=1 Tax=Kribbella sandramycini TaxID=60450 RepID=A0A7Y4L4L5_9ACTN|nr:anchored repeat ABC transporter, substrate-binding protein [Kribbella sandramycini]MBB6571596.1 anchored repeat ABC transporter substrate-binding protein [Kribbella sandramycini]NOL44242.1 anchored repeat ABC transporter, substrate-binding protein [Kribbella sandramycini]